MIKTIIFDMGGVIITLDPNEALRRFAVLGMNDFVKQMDPIRKAVSSESWKKENSRRRSIARDSRRYVAERSRMKRYNTVGWAI